MWFVIDDRHTEPGENITNENIKALFLFFNVLYNFGNINFVLYKFVVNVRIDPVQTILLE